MATRRQTEILKVGRPLRPADELRTFLADFDEHVSLDSLQPPNLNLLFAQRKAQIEEGTPALPPDSIVKTLSEWQNAHHTILNPNLGSATHEGRKLGMQLFKQAKNTQTVDVLFHLVKWLETLLTDIERNFTTPSAADMEESGSIFSWTHTQRLDYNFFRAMRTELVQNVKVWQQFQRPVPENCRGGVEHLGTAASSNASTNGQDTRVSTAATTPDKETPPETRKQLSPPVGGVGLPIGQRVDEQNGKNGKASVAQTEMLAPMNQAPPEKRSMVRPSILFNNTNAGFANGTGAGRPVVDLTKRVERFDTAGQRPQAFSPFKTPFQPTFNKDTTYQSPFPPIHGHQNQQAIPPTYASQNQSHEKYRISQIQKQQPGFSEVRVTTHQPQFELGGDRQNQQQPSFGYVNNGNNTLDEGRRRFEAHQPGLLQNAPPGREDRNIERGGMNVGSGVDNGGGSVVSNACSSQSTDEEELEEVDMVDVGHLEGGEEWTRNPLESTIRVLP